MKRLHRNQVGSRFAIQLLIAAGVLVAIPAAVHAQAPTAPVKTHLQLWVEADAGVTTNASGGVTGWKDQSGQNNNAVQTDDTMAPKWIGSALNGKPVLRFNGDTDYMNVAHSPSIAIAGDISTFAVVRFDDYANYREVWGKTVQNLPGANDWYMVQNSGVSRVYRGDGTSANLGSVDSNGPIATGRYMALGYSMAGTALTQYLNGYPNGSGVIAAPLADGGMDLKIGSRDDLFTKMKGDIAEILIYDTALSKTDLNAVFDYLIAKYALVPPEGAFISTSPTPGTTAAAPNLIQVVHRDGAVAWSSNNVTMSVDNTPVTPTFTRDGSFVTVAYVPTSLFAPQSPHAVTVTYPDATGKPLTMSWQFLVAGYTKDSVASRLGVFRGGSGYTANAQGHTGKAGDFGVDFTATGTGPIYVKDAGFLNTAAAKDEMTFAIWVKKYDIAAGSAFWANSPSSGDSQRGWQAHVPWNNDQIYFDTGNATSERINDNINTFSGYTGDDSWWTNWHFFVFSKKATDKQIWIDGKMFLEGTNPRPLPTDFTELYIGSDGTGAGLFHAIIDDFSVFSTQLAEADINSLFTGTLPSALPASKGLIAYWDFNDIPATGLFNSILPAPFSTNAAPNLIKVVHTDGSTALDASKVGLTVDGAAVTPTVTKSGSVITLTYVPTSIPAVGSTHQAALLYNAAPIYQWQFTIGAYTKDAVQSYPGMFLGGSTYSADGGGHTGKAGDRSVDFGMGTGPVWVSPTPFLNVAGTNNQITFSWWQKRADIANSSALWVNSPASAGGRGFNVHSPWSDDNLYFDTAGCCDTTTQRISANINTFSGWSSDDFWTNWHHFVVFYNATDKQIYIDGVQFLQGNSSNPLPTDCTDLYIGAAGGLGATGINNTTHGRMDDFAVFATALSAADIGKLATGTAPTALPASDKLVAYWSFDDFAAPPAQAPHIDKITLSGSNLTITWTGGGSLQQATALGSGASWTDVAGATASPATVPVGSNKTLFIRVKM